MKKLITSAIFCALWGLGGILFAQAIGTNFISYPQPGVFLGSEMVEAANGDLLVCGILGPKGVLARLDPCGDLLWQKDFQFGTGPTGFNDLVETPSGDIVVVGYCSGYLSVTRQRGLIMKTTSAGTLFPTSPEFPFPQDSLFAAIDLVPQDSGFIIGSTVDIPWFHESYASRLNSQFDSIWRVECDGFGTATFIYDLDADQNGVYLTGMTEYPFGENRIPAWKLDLSGNQIWYKELSPDTIPGSGTMGFAIARGQGNDLWVGGSVWSQDPDSSNPGLFKISSDSGNTLSFWAPAYSGNNEIHCIVPVGGHCLVGGSFGSMWPYGTPLNGKVGVMVFDANANPLSAWYHPAITGIDPTWRMAGMIGNGTDTTTWKWFGYTYGYPGEMGFGIRENTSLCPIVAIDEGISPPICKVYPNPSVSGDAIFLETEHFPGHASDVSIYSLTGSVLFRATIADGSDRISFSPGLGAGVYLLRVEHQAGIWSSRLVVTE